MSAAAVKLCPRDAPQLTIGLSLTCTIHPSWQYAYHWRARITPADNRPITDVHDSPSLHKSSNYASNSSGMSVTTINTRIRILLRCFLFRQPKFSIFWRFSCYIRWFFVPFVYSTHSEYPIIRCAHLVTSKTRSNKYSSLYRSLQIPLNRTHCVIDLIPRVHNRLDNPHATHSRPHKYIITTPLPDAP